MSPARNSTSWANPYELATRARRSASSARWSVSAKARPRPETIIWSAVFAALWSCSTTRAFAAALAPVLIRSAGRTSDLSSLYLREAANGEVSERLADVAAGICAGGSEEVVGNAVTKALAVGHSSGAAGIFGLLNGYSAGAEAPFQATADSMLAPAF